MVNLERNTDLHSFNIQKGPECVRATGYNMHLIRLRSMYGFWITGYGLNCSARPKFSCTVTSSLKSNAGAAETDTCTQLLRHNCMPRPLRHKSLTRCQDDKLEPVSSRGSNFNFSLSSLIPHQACHARCISTTARVAHQCSELTRAHNPLFHFFCTYVLLL